MSTFLLLLIFFLLLVVVVVYDLGEEFSGYCDSTNVRRRLAKEIVTDNVRNDLNPFGN